MDILNDPHLIFWRLTRPPLYWSVGPKVHWGLGVVNHWGEHFVFHSTPGLGEHACTYTEFAAGLDATRELIAETVGMRQRLLAKQLSPGKYDAATHNCQDSVNEIIFGRPSSPTRQLAVVSGVAAGLFWLLTRG